MKLAEALLLRADRNRTLEQLKQRIQVSARYQEGEQPPEDAGELVSAASTVLDELGARERHERYWDIRNDERHSVINGPDHRVP